MTDPYRPGYYQAPPHSTYQPSSYAPPSQDQYVSGALTTRRHSNGDNYYPAQSNMQLSQSSHRPPSSDSKYLDPSSDGHRRDSQYLDPADSAHRHSHHHHKSRSHSRHGDNRDRRERSKSRTKEWGSTAVGAAAGGLIGNELGHGPLATIGGLVAGAYGAHELEKRHERHQERKRLSGGDGERRHHQRRRSSGGLLDGLKGKVEGFLENPDADTRREREAKRRSRSHAGGGRRDEYEDYGGYEERRGGRSRRDDY